MSEGREAADAPAPEPLRGRWVQVTEHGTKQWVNDSDNAETREALAVALQSSHYAGEMYGPRGQTDWLRWADVLLDILPVLAALPPVAGPEVRPDETLRARIEALHQRKPATRCNVVEARPDDLAPGPAWVPHFCHRPAGHVGQHEPRLREPLTTVDLPSTCEHCATAYPCPTIAALTREAPEILHWPINDCPDKHHACGDPDFAPHHAAARAAAPAPAPGDEG